MENIYESPYYQEIPHSCRDFYKLSDQHLSVSSGNFDTGRKAVYRSSLYYGADEHGNNRKPYCWIANGGPMTWFGQEVSHWMPLPERPNDKNPGISIREFMELHTGGDS